MELSLVAVDIQLSSDLNIIIGQSHFIKTVEDIHEALVTAAPGIKFGLAFCEASGDCLIRTSGTDQVLVEVATQNALAIGAGHSFVLLLGAGFYPINVLGALRQVPEIVTLFCATANPLKVIVARHEQRNEDGNVVETGAGILGVIDGASPKGIEDDAGKAWRHDLLRRFGYKL